MSIQVPNQASFFYKGEWSLKTDNMLLSSLIRMRDVEPWEGDNIPDSVVVEAGNTLVELTGAHLTVHELKTRVKVLKERFETFNQVVHTSGVRWHTSLNFVEATDEVWKVIFQSTPFAGAYYHRDEPAFNQLATMFGMSKIKLEDERDIIVLSDTTEVVEQGLGNNAFSPTDTEEVISPMTVNSPPARRKLFCDGVTEDRRSSNVEPRGRSIPSVVTAPKSSPNASSSASWSPFGRNWKPKGY